MLALADKGDNTSVDMLVGDIYGADYGRIGLKSTTIASSFGKVFKKNATLHQKADDEEPADGEVPKVAERVTGPENIKNFKAEDISRSLLYAVRYISYSLVQVEMSHTDTRIQ